MDQEVDPEVDLDVAESLRRLGLRPADVDLDQVRERLDAEAARERHSQGDGDTELMTLCCVQLFNAGNPQDALRIWAAKRASFDAGFAIEVQLLCGAGLEETKAFLAAHDSDGAAAALDYVSLCEASGDFDGFTTESQSRQYGEYYQD